MKEGGLLSYLPPYTRIENLLITIMITEQELKIKNYF
jgi:hypothetical protein